MKLLTSILFLTFISHNMAQEVTSYNLDVKINAKEKTIHVEGSINIDFQKKDSINLILRKNSSIREIINAANTIQFYFDTLAPSPVLWIREGAPLILVKQPGSDDKQTIQFNYDCDMNELNGYAQSFSDEWVELNCYCAWYPIHFDSEEYTSEFQIYIDDNFTVTGSGKITHKENYWVMVQPWASFDNVIIASKHLKSKTLNENNFHIQTEYNGPDFSDADADSIIAECRYTLNLFEKYFGKKDSTYLKFVIAPFEWGGGYSRKNFVSMRTKHFNFYTATKGIAHEIAHFWWNGAKTITWEDWLNEAFAEYSMLITTVRL